MFEEQAKIYSFKT